MKITISQTGITIDLGEECAEILRDGTIKAVDLPPAVVKEKPEPVEAKPALFGMEAALTPKLAESKAQQQSLAELTKSQYQTWEYLEMNKNARNGVTVASLARELKISTAAAGQRLCQLHKLGYAKRISPGRYCSATPTANAA